jgi:hypothetical protein
MAQYMTKIWWEVKKRRLGGTKKLPPQSRVGAYLFVWTLIIVFYIK